jgi:hypothetical protein
VFGANFGANCAGGEEVRFRSFPPSFNPANILGETLDDYKTRKMLKESVDPERIRGEINKMILISAAGRQGRTRHPRFMRRLHAP